jgi:branched-chain amino acid transport system substrate-binding protein
MKKTQIITIFTLLMVMAFIAGACAPAKPQTIKIGVNAPLTGDIPKVGEGTKYAAEMWLEDVKAVGDR